LIASSKNKHQKQINQLHIDFNISEKTQALIRELEEKSEKEIKIKNKKEYANPLIVQQAKAFIDKESNQYIIYVGSDIDNHTLAHEVIHPLLELKGYLGTSTGCINKNIEQALKYFAGSLTSFILDQYVDYEMKLKGYDLVRYYDNEGPIVIDKLKSSSMGDSDPFEIVENAILYAVDIFRYKKQREEIEIFFRTNLPNGYKLGREIYKEMDVKNSNPVKCQLQIKKVIVTVDNFFESCNISNRIGKWTEFVPILEEEVLRESWKMHLEFKVEYVYNRNIIKFYNIKNHLLYKIKLPPPQLSPEKIVNVLNQYESYNLKEFLEINDIFYFQL